MHTPGPWTVEIPDGIRWVIRAGDYGLSAIAVTSFPDEGDDGANARLIAAACTSYDRAFGPAAVEAAEADLLEEALELLERLAKRLEGAREEIAFLREEAGREKTEFDEAADDVDERHLKEARAILSRIPETRNVD